MRCRQHIAPPSLRLLLVVVPLVLSPVVPIPAQILPGGFAFEAVINEPFEGEPTGFAFLPDGRILLIERETGHVALAPFGQNAFEVIHTVPGVNSTSGERGLLGVAVDPAYPARPYVYLLYSHASEQMYLTMYRASGDLIHPTSTNVSLSDPFHLIADAPDHHPVHHGGTLRFGKDGMLYVSLGDNITPCRAQDLTAFEGKLLRLDVSAMPEPGPGPPLKSELAPADNPFPGPSPIARLVYAYGLRNPFRFTIDAVSGDIFLGDVGLNDFEEIDHIPFQTGAGRNFGWPGLEGFATPNPPVPDCPPQGVLQEPLFAYEHRQPTPNAVIAGPLYRYDAFSPLSFPPEYEESYFFVDHSEGVIRRIVQTPDGWELAAPVLGQPAPLNWAEDVFFMVDMQLGPEGALYLLKRYAPLSGPGSNHPPGLYRILPVPPTSAPEIAGAPTRVRVIPNPARSGSAAWLVRGPGHDEAFSIRIFDARGRLVRHLVDPSPNASHLEWDTRDRKGELVRPGVYFFQSDEPGRDSVRGKISVLQ